MIFGLSPIVFFSFLSWPVTYIIIAIIMYIVMGKNDKKEEAWEAAYDEWQASLGKGEPEPEVVEEAVTEGGEDQ